MDVSKALGVYIRDRGYNLAEVARKTGLKYRSLYLGLYGDKKRELRAGEFLTLCVFLDIDPRKLKSPGGAPPPTEAT